MGNQEGKEALETKRIKFWCQKMSSIAESWLKSRQEAIFSLCPYKGGIYRQKCHHHRHLHRFHDPHSHNSYSVTYLVWLGPNKKVAAGGTGKRKTTLWEEPGNWYWLHWVSAPKHLTWGDQSAHHMTEGLFRLLRRFRTGSWMNSCNVQKLQRVVALSRLHEYNPEWITFIGGGEKLFLSYWTL